MQATTQARQRTGSATAPGTCGELAQGVLPDGRRFHVTCPIDRGVRVQVRLEPADRTVVDGLSAGMWKTEQALLRAATALGLGQVRIRVEHASALDRAKGLASSTADMVAAVRALARAGATRVDDESLATLVAAVEPSDGVMFEGVSAVDQHTGDLIRRWSWWPQFAIAMFTPTDVHQTGRRGAPALTDHAPAYADLLRRLDEAVVRRDAAEFAAQSTRSAVLNQPSVPNRLATLLLPRARDLGAAGLCVGHSGTVCGLLFHGDDAESAAAHAVERFLPRAPSGTAGDVVRTPAWPPAR